MKKKVSQDKVVYTVNYIMLALKCADGWKSQIIASRVHT